jgi:hypothetical protein
MNVLKKTVKVVCVFMTVGVEQLRVRTFPLKCLHQPQVGYRVQLQECGMATGFMV